VNILKEAVNKMRGTSKRGFGISNVISGRKDWGGGVLDGKLEIGGRLNVKRKKQQETS